MDRLVKSIFPYYCLYFWPQWSLLKWKARDPPVTWSSPLLLPYSNPTGSPLPPKTGSDSIIITFVSEVQACTHPASPWAFSLSGWPTACPPQILREALGTTVKVKEGRMGTCSSAGTPIHPIPLRSHGHHTQHSMPTRKKGALGGNPSWFPETSKTCSHSCVDVTTLNSGSGIKYIRDLIMNLVVEW